MSGVGKLEKSKESAKKTGKSSWLWPLGVAATSLAGVALIALRGCWHRRMSWPVRIQEHSYQVCLECGVKRLFDEKRFCSYGPFRYDLNELIDWEKQKKQATDALSSRSQAKIGAPEIGDSKIIAS